MQAISYHAFKHFYEYSNEKLRYRQRDRTRRASLRYQDFDFLSYLGRSGSFLQINIYIMKVVSISMKWKEYFLQWDSNPSPLACELGTLPLDQLANCTHFKIYICTLIWREYSWLVGIKTVFQVNIIRDWGLNPYEGSILFISLILKQPSLYKC